MQEKIDEGRLHYFEPNSYVFENKEGTNSDSITFPYDKYNVVVDLRVIVCERYSCGLSNETSGTKEYKYSTTGGTLSFFGGTNGFLTTNYTDIQNINPVQNTKECLGIESINITYDSWLHPTVVIKFVDIRGGTVMQPNEQNYYNEGEKGDSYHLYKSLFTFPYPLFILKVKGFYGKGVTYRLAVNKVDIDFDAKNGNFVIKVNFIGHIYGLFADIPVSYLAVAPYTEEGNRYWNEMINSPNKEFWFSHINGDGNEEPHCPMIKLPELAKKIAKVECAQNIINAESETHKTMKGLTAQKEALNTIISNYNILFNNPNLPGFMYCENDSKYSEMSYIFLHGGYELNDKDDSGIVEMFKNFLQSLDDYDKTFSVSATIKDKFVGIDDWLEKQNSYWEFTKETNFVEMSRNGNINNGFMANSEYFLRCKSEFIKTKTFEGNGSCNTIKVYFQSRGNGKKYSEVIEELTAKVNKIEERLKETNDELKKKNEAAVEQALGFRPSIKNMFDLMFAHLDTFIYVFYEHLKVIKTELDVKSENRAKSTYQIGPDFTDTENANGKNNLRGNYLPPFAAFYKESKDEDTNKAIKKEIWPGSIEIGNPNERLEEIKFVHELLSGSKLYFDEIQDALKTIEKYRQSGTTMEYSDSPSYDTSSFIPITIYDIANNGKLKNPYSNVAEKIGKNANINEIAGDIYALFSLREFYYIVTNRWNDKEKDSAKTFGRIEAINFYKALGFKASDTFKKFVKKYCDNSSENETEDFLTQITKGTNSTLALSWRNQNSPNTTPNLFEKTNSKIKYSYSMSDNGLVYFPLYVENINMIKNDFSNGNLNHNNRYISTTNHSNSENDTFLLFEDGKCVTNIMNNVNLELTHEKEEVEDENVKELFNIDDYDVVKGSKTFNMFSNDFNCDCNCVVNYEYFSKKDIETNKFEDFNNQKELIEVLQSNNPVGKNVYVKRFCNEILLGYNVDEVGVFNSKIYRLQENVIAKAYLFINYVGLYSNDSSVGSYGMIEKTNTVAQKISLLKEGSKYWFIENRDVFKLKGHINSYIKCLDKNKKPIYKEAEYAENVILESVEDVIKQINFNDKNKPNKTKSREKYLKKYFEDWATKDFANALPLLENLNLRKQYNKEWNYRYCDEFNLDLLNNEISYDEKLPKEAADLQDFLKDLMLRVCTIFDYYGGIYDTELVVDSNRFKSGFGYFMEQLNKIYGKIAEEDENKIDRTFMEFAQKQQIEDPFKSDDLRLSTYLTLKSLYDKWICGSLKGKDSWKLKRKRKENTSFSYELINSDDKMGDSGLYELDNFIYMDSLYRDIGHKLKVNMTKISEWISNVIPNSNVGASEITLNYNSKSLYEFLTEVAQDCGGYIIAIPQRFIFNNSEDIKKMFTPISSCEDWDDNCYTYMFLYSYRPSEHLGDTDTSNIDMNGWSPTGDGFNLTDKDIYGSLFCDIKNGYGVPAFGVTFGKGNQSYFKDIKLSTAQYGVTEAGLNATFQIASKSSETVRQTTLYGQDIYKVYSNNAYECTVEMMGDMQIFPPMYFQLNNIPMWKGAYMIKKVTHVITPDDATTTIVGVRQNKHIIPFTNGDIISFVPDESSYGGQYNTENYGVNSSESRFSVNPENFSGNTWYTGEYDINRASNYIRTHIHSLNPNPSGHNNESHDCAKHVRWAIQEGYNNPNSTAGHPYYAKEYAEFLPKIGFKKVIMFNSEKIKESGYDAQPGDIAVYEKPKNPNEPGHICMYDGNNWYSYFKQNSIYVYNSIGHTNIIVFRIDESKQGTS